MPSKKKILDKLSVGQKVTIVVAVLGGCCVVTAAFIGLGVPLISFYLDNSAQKAALATPTFLPPTDAVELPSNQLDILSVVIGLGPSDYEGIITKDIDPSTNQEITITKDDVTLVGDVTPRVEGILELSIYLTGKADDEEVQVTNKIPIRIIRFEPISRKTDLFLYGRPGGASFVPMLNASIDSNTHEAWAEYAPDIQQQFEYYQRARENLGDLEYKIPSELEEALSKGEQNLPDFYLVKKNEKIGIPVIIFINEPGIYYLQIGVEYIYRQYKGVSWAEPTIQVYSPNEINLWFCDYEWNLGSTLCKLDD